MPRFAKLPAHLVRRLVAVPELQDLQLDRWRREEIDLSGRTVERLLAAVEGRLIPEARILSARRQAGTSATTMLAEWGALARRLPESLKS